MALLELGSEAPRGGVMPGIRVGAVSDLMIGWRCPYQTTRFVGRTQRSVHPFLIWIR